MGQDQNTRLPLIDQGLQEKTQGMLGANSETGHDRTSLSSNSRVSEVKTGEALS
jgi:hypothetical protein